VELLLIASLLLQPDRTQEQDLQVSILALVVNQVPREEVIVYLGPEEIWVPVSALEDAGLSGFAGERRELRGEEFVEVGTLAPDITAEIDLQEVALRVDASVQYLPQQTLEMVNPRPADLQYVRSTSAYFNYSAQWDSRAGMSFFGETNFSFGGHSATGTFSIDSGGKFRRSTTNVNFDQPGSLRRWTLGDVQGRGLLLGSSPFVGGFRVGREFSLDPYFFSYATPSFSGAVTTPSTVEVSVNNQPARRFDLPPGSFNIGRLPVSSGMGNVTVIVRDVFGREQIFDSTYYLSTRVLKRGEQDYEYLAGATRQDTAERVEYGDPVGTARHRIGITDGFTLGYRLEGSEHIVNGGPTLNLKIGRAGEIELLAAASRGDGITGYAAASTYVFTSRMFSVNTFVRWLGDDYGDLFLAPDQPRNDLHVDAVATVPLFSRGSVSMGYRRQEVVKIDNGDGTFSFVPVGPSTGDDQERAVRRAVTGRMTYRLARFVQFTGTASWNNAAGEEFWEGYAGLTFLVGRRTAATASREWRDNEIRTRVDLNRSLPMGPGVGYRIEANDDRDGTMHATLQAQSRFARLSSRYDQERGQEGNGSVTLSGAIVGMGGRVAFSRPITGASYALVKLPEIRGVQVYANHQPMGRTGGSGTVFVPDLLAYLGNRISFDDNAVPLDVVISETSKQIAPPFRGGAVVEFPMRRLRAVAGTVVIVREGETVVPVYGDFEVETAAGLRRSPLTKTGRFYLDDITPGSHPARVVYAGEECRFDFVMPESEEPLTYLGEIRCVQQ